MLRLVTLLIVLTAVLIGGLYLFQKEPADYAAMAQSALAQSSAVTTDDDRLTAILSSSSAFVEIVGSLHGGKEAQSALPTLELLADEAKRLDNELRQDPDARRALLNRRKTEINQRAMQMAVMVISISSDIGVMTTISEAMATLSSTLQR